MVDYSGMAEDDNCDEFEITGEAEQDAETMKFDEIIGALEEFIMKPEFTDAQEAFCRSNCEAFEDTDENKLVYTEVFDRYTGTLESAMEAHLTQAVEGFSMAEFSGMLERRKDELYGDVFDLLMTLSSFEAFKELMLAYKAEAEAGQAAAAGAGGEEEGGKASGSGGGGGMIMGVGLDMMGFSVAPAHIYGEEQEDGEERPDLDICLTVTAGPGK